MASKPDHGQMSDWDPVAADVLADYPEAHKKLRQTAPVAYSDKWGGFFTLMRYADVVEASRSPDRFTATKMTVIPSSPRKGLPRLPLQKDPPESDRYRKGLNVFFKENRISQLEPQLRQIAKRQLEELLVSQSSADFARDFAEPFAQQSLCILLGLDLTEAAQIGALSKDYVEAVQAEDLEVAGELSRKVDQFAIDLVANRMEQPRDTVSDIVSGLMEFEHKGLRYNAEELAGMVRLMLIGGHIVPRNFLCSVAWHLASNPLHVSRLRAEPELMRPMVEELLRFYSANQALVRVATQNTEIGGQKVPQGCPVALNFLSANRDEKIFEKPMEFILNRSPNRHLAFGIGPHMCLGLALAKLQTRITIDTLLQAPGLAVSGEPKWARWTEYGVSELHLDLRGKNDPKS